MGAEKGDEHPPADAPAEGHAAEGEAASGEASLSAEHRRQRDLRVSDAEREHVVGLLQQAIGRGMLTLDEFTERTDTALAARTRGELNTVLVDLPGLGHPDVPGPAPTTPTTPAAAAAPSGVAGSAPTELRAHGAQLVRKGRWFVPAELSVRNRYADTRIDFSEAEFAGPEVHVRLDTKWCSVKFLVPEGSVVDLNGLDELKWATIHDRTHTAHATNGPRFVITGRLYGGSLTLRHPRRNWFAG
ncbi:DUF1707 SHOCT-like domain-containing protein [Saccharomonospora halophila]|uniref:DUF1707 SHOCT-like domain-containing protein n=1 Tax=Saccharomonospora halophila TaxID=129922 RepID=UPI00036EFE05|nr:DUF1707 domain-containing protein [Saccharomonospora halophila]